MKFLIIVSFIFLSANAQELNQKNTYKLIQTIDEIEIREYRPLLFASYIELNGLRDQNSSFRVLADYIFGSNKNSESIPMTSPVVIRLFNNNEMLFRMPDNYSKENVPIPNNNNVKFVETNYVKKAVISYSGYTSVQKEKKKIEELKTILEKNNIPHNNKFELLVYDPPYKLFNRRNEISVNILN